jgi:geranylgeranyl diphosphate synthase type II
MENYEERYNEYKSAILEALEGYLPEAAIPQRKLLEAMRYSLISVGKRLRPIMLLEFCRICGGDWRSAMPFACALEMIHTYSLIHDDMPCMDNDDDRRGRATNHIVYGEATALLAGSALLSAAFETMLRPGVSIPAERVLSAAYIIARSSGLYGIAGGQEVDLHHVISADATFINEHKTAAIFIAAAKAGCVIAGAPQELVNAGAEFGRTFGLAFQHADDYEDSGSKNSALSSALTAYATAKALLSPFEDTSFLTELINRLETKIGKKGS